MCPCPRSPVPHIQRLSNRATHVGRAGSRHRSKCLHSLMLSWSSHLGDLVPWLTQCSLRTSRAYASLKFTNCFHALIQDEIPIESLLLKGAKENKVPSRFRSEHLLLFVRFK